MTILPRQARDKHRENSKKDAVFRTTEVLQQLLDQRRPSPCSPSSGCCCCCCPCFGWCALVALSVPVRKQQVNIRALCAAASVRSAGDHNNTLPEQTLCAIHRNTSLVSAFSSLMCVQSLSWLNHCCLYFR